jgi:hypothetical protein
MKLRFQLCRVCVVLKKSASNHIRSKYFTSVVSGLCACSASSYHGEQYASAHGAPSYISRRKGVLAYGEKRGRMGPPPTYLGIKGCLHTEKREGAWGPLLHILA